MGRHTSPGTGKPAPDRGFWVRLAAAAVAVVLVAAYLSLRGDGDTATTAQPGAGASAGASTGPARGSSTADPSASPSPGASSSASSAPAPASSGSQTAAGRPPTLRLEVRRPSYITVRVPGGRTIVSRLFRAGERRSFDQKALQVVNGRPSAVRFTVNGKPRKPGPADQPETFTVRRR